MVSLSIKDKYIWENLISILQLKYLSLEPILNSKLAWIGFNLATNNEIRTLSWLLLSAYKTEGL